MQTSWKQKILLIFLGLFIFLVLAEGSLRLAGLYVDWRQASRNRAVPHSSNEFRILCVGESTTALGGEHAYPRYLEQFLNERAPAHSFRVINQGLPGRVSPEIVEQLPAWIQEYHPQLLVVMMGINDISSLYDFRQMEVIPFLHPFIKNLRIYKLAQWIKIQYFFKAQTAGQQPQSKLIQSDPRLNNPAVLRIVQRAAVLKKTGRYDEAISLFKKLIQLDQPHGYFYTRMRWELIECFNASGQYTEMTDLLKSVLKEKSNHFHALKLIREACDDHRGNDELIAMLKSLLDEFPNTSHFQDILISCYAANGQQEEAEHYTQNKKDLRAKLFNPETLISYFQLIKIIRENNLPAVFMEYPLRDIQPLRDMLAPTGDLSGDLFVSNKEIFKKAIREESYDEYFSDRFAGTFGHCTPKGNRLLASHLANEIIKKYFSD